MLQNWEDAVSRDRQLSDLQFTVSSLQQEIEHIHRQVEQLRSRNNDWEETDEGDFELVAEANAHSDFARPSERECSSQRHSSKRADSVGWESLRRAPQPSKQQQKLQQSLRWGSLSVRT